MVADACLADTQMTCARLVELETAAGRREHLDALSRDELECVAVALAHYLRQIPAVVGDITPANTAAHLRAHARDSAAGDPCDCRPCVRGLRT